MTLSDVQKLLSDNGTNYNLITEPSRAEFYRKKGFRPTKDTGSFCLLTITNPHHAKDIEIIFADASKDPEFYDLEFGGYWYEMFGCLEEDLPQMLLDEIQNIMAGRAYVIFAADANTGAWIYDGLFCDTPEEEWNDMDRFQKTVAKIKKPKNPWCKIIGRTNCYEIFNWTDYEKISK